MTEIVQVNSRREYAGLLAIGDPHIEGRVPGFRKDEYPRTVLDKLRWCLEVARNENLLPMILGDLFQLPRNNPNWIIVELLGLFSDETVAIYGNHDVHENKLCEDDSLSILVKAGRLKLLDEHHVVDCSINGNRVVVGGTSWGQPLPDSLPFKNQEELLNVVWLCHHDLAVSGYDAGNVKLPSNSGIDLVINGHIHKRLDPFKVGSLTCLTPGNISRRKRSDVNRKHTPSVLKIEFDKGSWEYSYIEVPHQPFENVFYESIADSNASAPTSGFVKGLKQLQERKTETGAGLMEFIRANEERFDPTVVAEIQSLACEVLNDVG